MKRKLPIILLFIALSTLAFSIAASDSCPQQDDTIEKDEKQSLNSELQSAIRHFQNGEYTSSILTLKKYSYRGVPEAKHLLAFHYFRGLAVKQNIDMAMSLFNDVASHYRKSQDIESKYRLGEMYVSSQGVSEKEGFESTLIAARSGHAKAQYLLSTYYRDGTVVPVDIKQEMYWLDCAAKNGVIDAIYEMGLKALWNENYDIAENYYALAAKKGHKDAMYNYGVMILTWQDNMAERDLGIDWIIKAASGSLPSRQASRFLEKTYIYGAYGLDKDMKKASYWRGVSQFDKPVHFLSYDLITE